jgi:hypothetical protein
MNVASQPGFVRGKYYADYVESVKQLRRDGREEEAERLLLELVDATEAENIVKGGWGVAPWYYEQLAIMYHKRGELRREVEILERFEGQDHAPGSKPPQLLRRLEKARALERKGS